MKVSEICFRTQQMDCDHCEREDCGDNTNPRIEKNKPRRQNDNHAIIIRETEEKYLRVKEDCRPKHSDESGPVRGDEPPAVTPRPIRDIPAQEDAAKLPPG